MADRNTIDIRLLRQLLDYDPATGEITWLARDLDLFPDERSGKIWNTRYAGKAALRVDRFGYRRGSVFGVALSGHRIAWAMTFGVWPVLDMDHINGVRHDNRIENLRCVTNDENRRNMKRDVRNKSGVTGVSWYPPTGKWLARISKKYIGYFETFEQAVAARKDAEAANGYHPNHGRSARLRG